LREIGVSIFLFIRSTLNVPLRLVFLFVAGANLVGSDLYNKLTEYFASHFKPIVKVR
jgi:hypothetical protein